MPQAPRLRAVGGLTPIRYDGDRMRAGQAYLPGPFSASASRRGCGRTMIIAALPGRTERPQFLQSAPIQTAFGPFFTVYLTQQGWSQVDIGFALSVGTARGAGLSVAGRVRWSMPSTSSALAASRMVLLASALSALMLVAAADAGTGPDVAQVLHGLRQLPAHAGDRRAHA